MANIEVKKVEERLNHGLLFSGRVNADEGHTEFPDRHPGSGIGDCKRSRCACLHACLRGRARRGDTTPVRSRNNNTSLSIQICGNYKDDVACRL
jgi:hypothetical protein